MKRLLFLLLAAALIVPAAARAETTDSTRIALTNGTGYWIDVDTYEQRGVRRHWGIVAPNDTINLLIGLSGTKVFTDVYVYVKAGRSANADATLCTVTKTFRNADGRSVLRERVHFNGKTCSIDPA